MSSFRGHNPAGEVPKTSDMSQAMSFAPALDPQFPSRLRRLAKVPAGLWFLGRLPAAHERGVAIVGSRAATAAGAAGATRIAAELARAGRFVVSGGALGIDAAAHRGALEAGGVTFAVLGCGVDVDLPRSSSPALRADRARRRSALGVSARLAPRGRAAFRCATASSPRWPRRSSSSKPGRHSGALITAQLALEAGQTLIAVPGSAGTDQLLAQRVGVARRDRRPDVLRRMAGEMRFAPERAGGDGSAAGALEDHADNAAGIAQRLGVTLPAALGVLAEAELSGWVRRLAGGRYEVPHVS